MLVFLNGIPPVSDKQCFLNLFTKITFWAAWLFLVTRQTVKVQNSIWGSVIFAIRQTINVGNTARGLDLHQKLLITGFVFLSTWFLFWVFVDHLRHPDFIGNGPKKQELGLWLQSRKTSNFGSHMLKPLVLTHPTDTRNSQFFVKLKRNRVEQTVVNAIFLGIFLKYCVAVVLETILFYFQFAGNLKDCVMSFTCNRSRLSWCNALHLVQFLKVFFSLP